MRSDQAFEEKTHLKIQTDPEHLFNIFGATCTKYP